MREGEGVVLCRSGECIAVPTGGYKRAAAFERLLLQSKLFNETTTDWLTSETLAAFVNNFCQRRQEVLVNG